MLKASDYIAAMRSAAKSPSTATLDLIDKPLNAIGGMPVFLRQAMRLIALRFSSV